MPLLFQTGGTYKSSKALYAKVGGAWKPAKKGYIKAGGTWYPFYVQAINDDWNRIVSTGLGTDLNGDSWTILRGTWSVESGRAKEKSGKDAVPLATIDLGILNVTGKINQLSPGMGMAVRGRDLNNFWGIVPYYTQTATPYTYCASYGTPYSQCVSSHQSGYTLGCASGVYYTTVPGACIKYEQTYDCLPPGFQTVCSTVPGACHNRCDYNFRYAEENNGALLCYTYCDDPTTQCLNTCPNGFGLVDTETCLDRGPDQLQQNCDSGFYQIPTYVCDQSVQITPCNSYATGYTYTNYYYVRLFKMVGGVMTVVQDYPVGTAWTALQVIVQDNSLGIKAFSDDAYATNVLDTTFTLAATPSVAATEPAGTQYGIVGIASSYNDGAYVGPITVGAIGQ
jgi:hypothetical protein